MAACTLPELLAALATEFDWLNPNNVTVLKADMSAIYGLSWSAEHDALLDVIAAAMQHAQATLAALRDQE